MSMSIFCTCTINVQCTLLLDRSCTKVQCIGTKCYVLDLSLWNITTCDDQWSVKKCEHFQRFEWFLAKFTFKLWGNENFPVSCNFQVTEKSSTQYLPHDGKFKSFNNLISNPSSRVPPMLSIIYVVIIRSFDRPLTTF